MGISTVPVAGYEGGVVIVIPNIGDTDVTDIPVGSTIRTFPPVNASVMAKRKVSVTSSPCTLIISELIEGEDGSVAHIILGCACVT
jgi:hypothetical protein